MRLEELMRMTGRDARTRWNKMPPRVCNNGGSIHTSSLGQMARTDYWRCAATANCSVPRLIRAAQAAEQEPWSRDHPGLAPTILATASNPGSHESRLGYRRSRDLMPRSRFAPPRAVHFPQPPCDLTSLGTPPAAALQRRQGPRTSARVHTRRPLDCGRRDGSLFVVR